MSNIESMSNKVRVMPGKNDGLRDEKCRHLKVFTCLLNSIWHMDEINHSGRRSLVSGKNSSHRSWILSPRNSRSGDQDHRISTVA